MSRPRVVLASSSPRRVELLGRLGLTAEILPQRVDEAPLPRESPAAHVERLARAKAEAAWRAVGGGPDDVLIVGGDTVVVDGDRILGKPEGIEEAVATLLELSGRAHDVLSGVALRGAHGTLSAVGSARVVMRPFGEADARAYAATGEPLDKAGAYGIQGMGAALVEEVRGDYYSVVGLPLARLVELLARAGWRYAFPDLNRR